MVEQSSNKFITYEDVHLYHESLNKKDLAKYYENKNDRRGTSKILTIYFSNNRDYFILGT